MQNHKLEIFIDKHSKYLILGSFPSVKSRERAFYYSNPTNRFYKVLFSIFNEIDSGDTEDRKDFLKRHDIALYDVIEKCDIQASYDSSIRNVVPIDIEKYLKMYPNTTTIGVTGKTAQKLFSKYLLDKVDQSKIRIVYLPSTSPANAKMRTSDLVELFKLVFI